MRTHYDAGKVIIRENEYGETAYVIEEGRVEVTKQNVHLAYLGPGEIFGEMSMIDEKPRSATVIAVTDTVVSEMRREDFFNSFQTNPNVALTLLKVLFERFREAQAVILQLQRVDPQHALVPKQTAAIPAPRAQLSISLEGMTPRAIDALPENPYQITRFPFRIGRQSSDPLIYNDLMLPDSVPLQISRHHLALITQEDHVGVVDRGSTLGSWVDGQHIGGSTGHAGPVFFTRPAGLLVLGGPDSPFKYRVSIG